jgi:hypothetical protein
MYVHQKRFKKAKESIQHIVGNRFMHSDDNKSEPTSWCASLQILGRNVREPTDDIFFIWLLVCTGRLHDQVPNACKWNLNLEDAKGIWIEP